MLSATRALAGEEVGVLVGPAGEGLDVVDAREDHEEDPDLPGNAHRWVSSRDPHLRSNKYTWVGICDLYLWSNKYTWVSIRGDHEEEGGPRGRGGRTLRQSIQMTA